MLEVQKLLGVLVMPVGLLWLLLGALLALGLRARRWGLAAGAGLAWLLLAVAGNLHVGVRLAGSIEAAVPDLESTLREGGPFDAVCVLGGGTSVDPAGQPQLCAAGDRVRLAAMLWHRFPDTLLVATGIALDDAQGQRNMAQETRAIWRGLGVPDRAILPVAEPCRNTREEVAALRRLRDRHGWKRVGLISSATHLPRALDLARREGLVVHPIGADWLGRPRRFRPKDVVPQWEGLSYTTLSCWEYLGRALGR